MQPWKILATHGTRDGELALSVRGDEGAREYLITVAGRVLMNSFANRSELAVADLACRRIADRPEPRVLIGGLGMGCTLRAGLDTLPAAASVTVVELHEVVVDWCRDALAGINGRALFDERVEARVEDVATVIASSPRRAYDAIVLDLFEGPHARTDAERDPFYGRLAIEQVARVLRPGGIFAVWSEEPDDAFERRLRRASFSVERARPGRGGRRHAVYVAERERR